MILDEDTIDVSCFIPDGEPILTPEQERRIGRIDGERGGIEYRVLACRTMLGWLYEADHISADQFHAACDYLHWRDYFAALWAGQKMRGLDIAPSIDTDGITATRFSQLLRKLSPHDQKLIDFSAGAVITEHLRWLALRSIRHYREAFEHLESYVTDIKGIDKK